jgi:hypothetical protein
MCIGVLSPAGRRSGRDFTAHPFYSKLKFTLEQAMKAQRGSRGIAILFL